AADASGVRSRDDGLSFGASVGAGLAGRSFTISRAVFWHQAPSSAKKSLLVCPAPVHLSHYGSQSAYLVAFQGSSYRKRAFYGLYCHINEHIPQSHETRLRR